MRVTLVIASLEAGGAERVISVLASELSKRHAITLVKLSKRPDHYRVAADVDIVEVSPAGRWRLIRATIDKFRILLRLRRAIRSSSPDVVVSFIDFTNVRTILATRLSPTPVVASERTDPSVHRIKRSHAILRRLTYRWASLLVVQTNPVKTWAEKLVKRERVAVVPNPLSFEPFPDVGDNRRAVVLAVGRLAEEKRFEVLIDAFVRVAPRHPAWSLRIVGQGPLEAELRRRAEGSGFGARIEFPGLQYDIVSEYRVAGIFVLSSRYEGFPNALLEALATGTPSITTDCPSGPRELVGDSGCALFVPVDDIAAMAETLDHLMRDPSKRRALGERGLVRSRDFTAARIVAHWEELLQSAVDGV